jgi:hypothetical protein
MTMPLAAFEFTSVLTTFELTVRTAQTEEISDLTMLAGPPIIEIALVLVLILEFDLPHVIQAAISKGASLSSSIISDSRLETVAKGVIIDAMSIGLIIYKLTDECALVLESHLALPDAFIVHEFPLIYVTVLEIVDPAAISL